MGVTVSDFLFVLVNSLFPLGLERNVRFSTEGTFDDGKMILLRNEGNYENTH